MVEENKDYTFLSESFGYETTPVKLLTGDYKDAIVCFGRVQIEELDEYGRGSLKFGFVVVSPKDKIKQYTKDAKFKNYLGTILEHIILGAVDNETVLEKDDLIDDSEIGKNNTEEPNERQRLLPEGPSISEGRILYR